MRVNIYTPIFKNDNEAGHDGGTCWAFNKASAIQQFKDCYYPSEDVIGVELLGSRDIDWEIEEFMEENPEYF